MSNIVLLRLTSPIATDIFAVQTVEDAIRKSRKLRKQDEVAHYSIDGGKNWLAI